MLEQTRARGMAIFASTTELGRRIRANSRMRRGPTGESRVSCLATDNHCTTHRYAS